MRVRSVKSLYLSNKAFRLLTGFTRKIKLFKEPDFMYTRIDSGLFKSERVAGMTREEKLCLFYVLANDDKNSAGAYHINIAHGKWFVGVDKDRMIGLLLALEEYGVILFDKKLMIVFIKMFIKHSKTKETAKSDVKKISASCCESNKMAEYISYLSGFRDTIALASALHDDTPDIKIDKKTKTTIEYWNKHGELPEDLVPVKNQGYFDVQDIFENEH